MRSLGTHRGHGALTGRQNTPECCVRPSTFTGPATLPTRSYMETSLMSATQLPPEDAGHCIRHPELSAQPLVLWEPSHGRRGRGRPKATYVDTLKRDTGARDAAELATLMRDRDIWHGHVVGRRQATK